MAKPQELSSGWRPINIVPSVSKIIEKCFLVQLTEYLKRNNFINFTHHGSVKGRGTQTLVQELFDNLMESVENDEVSAVIQTDQSKAYDVVNHDILLAKMKILGFNHKTLNIPWKLSKK